MGANFHVDFSYLYDMPGTNKYTNAISSNKVLLSERYSLTAGLLKINRKLRFFPTCKDFHN